MNTFKPNFLGELFRPHNYITLFICSFIVFLASPLIGSGEWARFVLNFLMAMLLLSATLAASPSKHISYPMLILGILAGISWVLGAIPTAPFTSIQFEIGTSLITLTFLVTSAVIMLWDTFQGHVSANKIFGALCIYLNIGIFFAILFMTIFIIDPSAFKIEPELLVSLKQGSAHRLSLFFYFSFCTMTTLGYGDMTPINNMARTLSWMEAVIGQLYLTVLIARLVGLHIAAKFSATGSYPVIAQERENE